VFPEVKVHAPHGVFPKVTVRSRTVLDYQPSWLLLAAPALMVLGRRRRAASSPTTTSAPASDGSGRSRPHRHSSDTARAVMTGGVQCVREDETVLDAARKMRQLGVGALPICGRDDRLKGMLTDRDIVVKVLAEGKDPSSTTAGDLAQGKPVTVGADDSLQELVRTMAEHQVKRLPVIDGHKLVGVVSEADVAEHAKPEQVVAVVRGVYDQNRRRRLTRAGRNG
jgi:CBS domain-containing protein